MFILNSHGEVLCHQRPLTKETCPGVWITHMGGHIGIDETPHTNALKELSEEAGIDIKPEAMVHWRTTQQEDSRFWMTEFVTLCDLKAEDLTPQPGEVEKFQWFTPEEIFEHARTSPDSWKAGTHNFMIEYYCLRAVIAAAGSQGTFSLQKPLHVWNLHPIAL